MAKMRGRRKPMSRGRSRKVFRKASGSHKKNRRANPMRGGIRL